METGPRKYSESGLFRDVWKALNGLIEHVRRVSPLAGDGLRITRTVNGSVIGLNRRELEQVAGSVLKQYRLKDETPGDYLICRSWDGENEGSIDIFIAKPFRLRQTPFDGETITFDSDGDSYVASYAYLSATNRNTTIGGVVERQIVVPTWKTDFDIIYAMEVVEPTGVEDADENPITLLDINADGRAWARAFNQ